MYRLFIIFISFLFLHLFLQKIAFCEGRLLLYNAVNVENKDLVLGDIASIESNDKELNSIKEIIIPSELYSDGYIDRKEISRLLQNHSKEIFFIYGNAVRVTQNLQINDNSIIGENGFTIKKGDRVNFIVKKNGIHIEINALALNDGKMEDEIFVKLEKKSGQLSKIVKGRVKSRGLIEAVL